MSEKDLSQYTFLFCDLNASEFDCPKKDTCKRYQLIKDVSYNSYKDCSARLYNICKEKNFLLYLKPNIQPPVKKEDKKEDKEEEKKDENAS